MNIKQVAETLLQRSLVKEDGILEEVIKKAEEKLGIQLPESLRNVYVLIGNQPMFMSSFQRFLKPEALFLMDDKLVFLEENQEVCYWAVDKQEKIFQGSENNWFSEELNLTQFIELLLYYQCAQGGYEYAGALAVEYFNTSFFEKLEKGWKKVVDYNHLLIFYKEGKLIWFFTDENQHPEEIFTSNLTREKWEEMKIYGFEEL